MGTYTKDIIDGTLKVKLGSNMLKDLRLRVYSVYGLRGNWVKVEIGDNHSQHGDIDSAMEYLAEYIRTHSWL